MFRTVQILVIALAVATVQGRDCTLGSSSNVLEQVVNQVKNHCPGILDGPEKSYCCPSTEGFYCCDAGEFAIKTGVMVIIPVIIGCIAVLAIIIFCISCLCCSCCPWYKRRHRGTVYGKVHTPAIVTVVQPATVQVPQAQLYPAHVPTAQPPPYTPEAYTKQAPYNPGYQA